MEHKLLELPTIHLRIHTFMCSPKYPTSTSKVKIVTTHNEKDEKRYFVCRRENFMEMKRKCTQEWKKKMYTRV